MTRAAAPLSADTIRRAVQGDRPAVARLVESFLPRVYGLCLRVSRRRQVAEEATQETFVRVLRALPKLRRPDRLQSWVLTIASRTTLELLRRSSRTAPLDFEPPAPAPASDPHARRRAAVEHALGALPPADRSLFCLHTAEGVPLKALARSAETTESAIKAKLHRVRAKVRTRARAYLVHHGETP